MHWRDWLIEYPAIGFDHLCGLATVIVIALFLTSFGLSLLAGLMRTPAPPPLPPAATWKAPG